MFTGRTVLFTLSIYLTTHLALAAIPCNASDLIKTGVFSPNPDDYFDLGQFGSMEYGTTTPKDDDTMFLKSCQYYHNVRVEGSCILIEAEKEKWTDFINVDSPASGAGDNESLSNIRNSGIDLCGGGTPLRAICRQNGVEFTKFSATCGPKSVPNTLQHFCDPREGLVCRNSDQAPGETCRDYEIQFLCPRRILPLTVSGILVKGLVNLTAPSELVPRCKARRTAKCEVQYLIKAQYGRKWHACYSKIAINLRIDCPTGGHARQYYDIGLTGLIVMKVNKAIVSKVELVAIVCVNAQTGKVFKSWLVQDFATPITIKGVGGNDKTGEFRYGEERDKLLVTHEADTNQCVAENVNVLIVHNMDTVETLSRKPVVVSCILDNAEDINGGKSPVNDLLSYVTKTVDFFKERNMNVSTKNNQLLVRAHYGSHLANAFYNYLHNCVSFGDGNTYLHPFTSIDIAAHEVAHAVTHLYSNLAGLGESGAMNEAFSDIVGEVMEDEISGSHDWLVGADIVKRGQTITALRFFELPSTDARSMDSYDPNANYDKIDVHYSSGIYRRAFYELSKKIGFRPAFNSFLLANFSLWKQCTKMRKGVCGVEEGARRQGYSVSEVTEAFQLVNLQCNPNEDESC